ncbi:MAG TPA: hypothetical protein VIU39_08895, partial [Anaerolineales bacterium]
MPVGVAPVPPVVGVAEAAGAVPVTEPLPSIIITVSGSPKKTPPASAMRQVPETVPLPLAGAVIG